MPKILITGNGFDLSFGLPTAYSDFIHILNYISNYEDLSFESIYGNTSGFNLLESNFKFFDLNRSEIEKLKVQLTHNWWFNFFKDEYELETWIDFENKIEYVLRLLFSSVNYVRENIFSHGSLNNEHTSYGSEVFNNDIEILQILSNFGIIDFNNNTYISFAPRYLVKKYSHFVDIDVDTITKDLQNSLTEFKIIFNYYFEIFVFPFYPNLKIKSNQTFFKTINRHYTFNYTPTFEKIFDKSTATHFLHGKINSRENQIVLGINEIPISEKIEKKFFIPFTKYFQKLNNETDYVFIKEFEKRKDKNYTFFFWGHSLDKSDEDYINEVFDFINESKADMKRIVVIYHNTTAKSKLIVNLLDIRGKKDIQDLMRNKILIFTQIDSKEMKEELQRNLVPQSVRIT